MLHRSIKNDTDTLFGFNHWNCIKKKRKKFSFLERFETDAHSYEALYNLKGT